MSEWLRSKLAPAEPQVAGLSLPPQPQQAPLQHQAQQQQPAPVHEVPAQQVHDAAFNDPSRELSLREAVTRWEGGPGMRKEGHLNCPQCSSKSGYTEYTDAAVGVPGGKPRPHCFECGYNGSYQQGDKANWS